MPPSVSLIGIAETYLKNYFPRSFPCVTVRVENLGGKDLQAILGSRGPEFKRILVYPKKQTGPSLMKIYIADPEAFLKIVRNNSDYWEGCTGVGWKEAMEALGGDMMEDRLTYWWFVREG